MGVLERERGSFVSELFYWRRHCHFSCATHYEIQTIKYVQASLLRITVDKLNKRWAVSLLYSINCVGLSVCLFVKRSRWKVISIMEPQTNRPTDRVTSTRN